MTTSKQQLFGSQALKPTNSSCWCLYPIELSFTDRDRDLREAKIISEQIQWLKTLNHGVMCHEVECAMELNPVSKNDFPE